jgi:hypothetical protein
MGINVEEIMNEIFGAVGYRDGGKRFVKTMPQMPPSPQQNLMIQKLQAEIEKARNQGKGALLSGLAAVKKVDLGNAQLEAAQTDADRDHAHRVLDRHMAAFDLGHRHANELADRVADGAAEKQSRFTSPLEPGCSRVRAVMNCAKSDTSDFAGRGEVDGAVAPSGGGDSLPADSVPVASPHPAAPGRGDPPPQSTSDVSDVDKSNPCRTREHASSAWEGGTSGAPLPDDQTALLAHLAQLLSAPRRRIVRHHRGPDGRVTHSEVIDGMDGDQCGKSRQVEDFVA